MTICYSLAQHATESPCKGASLPPNIVTLLCQWAHSWGFLHYLETCPRALGFFGQPVIQGVDARNDSKKFVFPICLSISQSITNCTLVSLTLMKNYILKARVFKGSTVHRTDKIQSSLVISLNIQSLKKAHT